MAHDIDCAATLAGRTEPRPKSQAEFPAPGPPGHGVDGPPAEEGSAVPAREGLDSTTWTWHDSSWTRSGSLLHHEVWATDLRVGHVAAVVHERGRACLEVTSTRMPGRLVIPAGLVSVVDHHAGLVLLNVTSHVVDEAPGVPPASSLERAGLRRLGRHYGPHARRVVMQP